MSFWGPTEIKKSPSIQVSCTEVLPQNTNKKQEVVGSVLQGTASLQILVDYDHLRISLLHLIFKANCRGAATDFREDQE